MAFLSPNCSEQRTRAKNSLRTWQENPRSKAFEDTSQSIAGLHIRLAAAETSFNEQLDCLHHQQCVTSHLLLIIQLLQRLSAQRPWSTGHRHRGCSNCFENNSTTNDGLLHIAVNPLPVTAYQATFLAVSNGSAGILGRTRIYLTSPWPQREGELSPFQKFPSPFYTAETDGHVESAKLSSRHILYNADIIYCFCICKLY